MSTKSPLAEAEKLLERATLKENSSDFDGAFPLYIQAAQQFLQLSRTSSSQQDKTKCRNNAAKSLERAEKIKAAKRDLKPVVDDPYSDFNQESIVEVSSNINGERYPSWRAEHVPTTIPLTRASQPALSPLQQSLDVSYRRPPRPYIISQDLNPEDLSQNSVTDCSLIASIATCLNHRRRFGSNLAVTCFAQQSPPGVPSVSRNGTYSFKLLCNGTQRRVEIDDSLPFDRSGNAICAYSMDKKSQAPNLLPSLIEKAYMRLQGGYDFRGSNSGADLYSLIGWIPECIHFRGREFVREKTWNRIRSAFLEGRCLVTLGTGATPAVQYDDSEGGSYRRDEAFVLHQRLLESHCYAVLDIDETEEERLVTFLDPWQDPNNSLIGSRSQRYTWETICDVFDTVYISWDPQRWNNVCTIHRVWKAKQAGRSSTTNHRISVLCPTLSNVRSHSADNEIWILLTRHLGRKAGQEEQNKFIALHATEYHNIDASNRLRELDAKGTYCDDCHVLMKVVPRSDLITLIASLDGDHSDDTNYTLTIYSNKSVEVERRSNALLYSKLVESNFTLASAGGNFSSSLFMNNPQWSLKVVANGHDYKASVRISIEGEKTMALNGCVVWSHGERITDIVKGDIVASTGEYRYGVASCAAELKPGNYNLIISTFMPKTLGSFSIHVDSSNQFEMSLIPQEGAGLYRKVVRGNWKANLNAGGSPKFGKYETNPRITIQLNTAAQVKIRLRSTPISALNLTLFEREGEGEFGNEVATTGSYNDSPSGVATTQLTLARGTYIAVPSTYMLGAEAEWELIVFCDKRDAQVAADPE